MRHRCAPWTRSIGQNVTSEKPFKSIHCLCQDNGNNKNKDDQLIMVYPQHNWAFTAYAGISIVLQVMLTETMFVCTVVENKHYYRKPSVHAHDNATSIWPRQTWPKLSDLSNTHTLFVYSFVCLCSSIHLIHPLICSCISTSVCLSMCLRPCAIWPVFFSNGCALVCLLIFDKCQKSCRRRHCGSNTVEFNATSVISLDHQAARSFMCRAFEMTKTICLLIAFADAVATVPTVTEQLPG